MDPATFSDDKGEEPDMPNSEIIRAWEDGYRLGQQDFRRDLPCAGCPMKAPDQTPSNVVSLLEFTQRKLRVVGQLTP